MQSIQYHGHYLIYSGIPVKCWFDAAKDGIICVDLKIK